MNELQEVVKSVKDNTLIQTELVLKLSLILIKSNRCHHCQEISLTLQGWLQAQISGDDVLSIGGQNNRYNAILLMELITMFWIIFKRY
jgi:hypothetical protein